MFVGRKKELHFLEDLCTSKKFEMLIMHGRRRVGKSFLLAHFASNHNQDTVFFTADKGSEKDNVQRFCMELKRVLNAGDFLDSLETWQSVYSFIESTEITKRITIIIDEFTYLYNSNPAYDSGLQNAIDRILKNKNIFLILCGSEVSVIEELFDNSTKPLYGRKTADLKLKPFTYKEAKAFFPKYNNEEILTAYSILGGMPLYLSLFDDSLSIRENIIKNCLSTTGYLFNEIDTLLRMELKETFFYKNIMLAINSGASTLNDIKTKIGEDSAKIAKYINVLVNLGFIKAETPVGEKVKTRNTLYSIDDNYFAFYFRFIYKHLNMLNGLISPVIYYNKEFTTENLNTYIGHRFEQICSQFLKEKAYNGELPFFAEEVGRWWGNKPIEKRQEEIDIVAQDSENAILCECKYTEKPFDEKELSDLQASAPCIKRNNKFFWIFSKKGISPGVKKIIQNQSNYKVITVKDLFA
ncbi:MAG: ATP-binding protein [Fibrobacter sp.]|nr:ATP-binding protein [Fibrobacter sp.]